MPTRVLSEAELDQLTNWPAEVAHSDLVEYVTLNVEDLRWVRSYRGAATQLGLSVQLCGLRFLGFVPADLAATPVEVTERLAERVGVPPGVLGSYAGEVDGRLRRLHVAVVIARCGWRHCGHNERKMLDDWLLARALEHDDAALLFGQVLTHLRAERIVRPGLDRLGRSVAQARVAADREIAWRLRPQLTAARCEQLDHLIVTDTDLGVAPLVWLDTGATSSSPESIKAEITKLGYLRKLGADRLDLSMIGPERLRQLATVGRRSTPKALRAMPAQRRYPILLATLAQTYASVIDEIVQMFDQALTTTNARARAALVARQLAAAEGNLERLVLLDDILEVALDPDRDDAAVGAGVRGLGPDRLAAGVRGHEERAPRDGGHLALLEARYAHVRSFAPQVLAALSFHASVPSATLDAVNLLTTLNAEGRRHVPPDAPVGFVPTRWAPYLTAARAGRDENAYKHYWELCVLFGPPGSKHRTTNDLARLCRPRRCGRSSRTPLGQCRSNLLTSANGPDRWYFAESYGEALVLGTHHHGDHPLILNMLVNLDAHHDRHLKTHPTPHHIDLRTIHPTHTT
ncbi:MAG: DUF4158 domain-containing protein [Pseudonocardiaceae bacterium]